MADKVIVGMSGGVDSSITAFLLKQQGFDVEGVSFTLYEARMRKAFSKAPCCSIEAMNDAAKTADSLGIKHKIIDLREEFIEKVIEPFISSYYNGTTPNPCILCNKFIKFPYLLNEAEQKNAKFIATGHYANIAAVDKTCFLMKGIDAKKDQSYVLYALDSKTLSRLTLPLGKMTKNDVRETAKKLDIPAAKRKESQEICFIDESGYPCFIDGMIESKEGPLIDAESGKILGHHKGIHLFTVGQRKRLGIATGKPCYVIKIDSSENAVYIGTKGMAMRKQIIANEVNWLIDKNHDFKATVKIRSMMQDEPAIVEIIDKFKVRIIFDQSQWAPAPGQSAVFYQGNVVVGGGIIVSSVLQD